MYPDKKGNTILKKLTYSLHMSNIKITPLQMIIWYYDTSFQTITRMQIEIKNHLGKSGTSDFLGMGLWVIELSCPVVPLQDFQESSCADFHSSHSIFLCDIMCMCPAHTPYPSLVLSSCVLNTFSSSIPILSWFTNTITWNWVRHM